MSTGVHSLDTIVSACFTDEALGRHGIEELECRLEGRFRLSLAAALSEDPCRPETGEIQPADSSHILQDGERPA
jgi:hypothetical protein